MGGVMKIQTIHWPQPIPPAPLLLLPSSSSSSSSSQGEEEGLVMMISDLQCGFPTLNNQLSREWLLDYLAGYASTANNNNDNDECHSNPTRIARIILAGGACTPPRDKSSTLVPLQELDSFLYQICRDL